MGWATSRFYIGGWPSDAQLVPTVQCAVLDVTCELPLQVNTPVDGYKALLVWDTHGEAQGRCIHSIGVTIPSTQKWKTGRDSAMHIFLSAGPTPHQIDEGVAWAEQQVAAGRPVSA